MSLPYPEQSVILNAEKNDIKSVSTFIEDAQLIHRNLDWRSLLQWISEEPFLLKISQKRIQGLFSCAPDIEGMAWIHCFASRYHNNFRETWLELLDIAREHPAVKGCLLCSVGLQEWFNELLYHSGFNILQNIVVLNWNGIAPKELPVSQEILLRPMEIDDLDQVVQVDHQAFAPIWEISQNSLRQAYMQSEHASVAEINDQIVGYELSTANHFSAHLARLAVRPQYMKANIGYSLVRDMLIHFSKRGVKQVSVNTQNDNIASVSLYKKLGFILTDETFPVYILQL